jgi:peptidoglycan/LPS O-acetylase OafA/YrhL
MASIDNDRYHFDPKRNSLNAVRLFFATLVIVSHSCVLGAYRPELGVLGNTLGGWGVIGFFCASGYLIASSRSRNGFPVFLSQRVARLFPAYIVCNIAVALAFAPIAKLIASGDIAGFLTEAPTPYEFLAANINPSLHNASNQIGSTLSSLPFANSWDGPLYTLYYEFLSYLIIAVMFFVERLRKPLPVGLLWLLTVAVQFADKVKFQTTFDYIFQLVPFFLGGAFFFTIEKKVPLKWQLALPIAIALVAAVHFTPLHGWNGTALYAPFITYLILWFANTVKLGGFGDLTRRHDISYGVYIYGWPVQQMLVLLWVTGKIPKPSFGLNLAIVCAVTAILATLSWRLVEKPIMDRVKSGLKKYKEVRT